MLSPNAFPVQFPGKQAHLKCQSQSLLSRHGTLDVDLNRLRFMTRVGKRHGENGTTQDKDLSARYRPNNNKWFLPGRYGVGERGVG